MGSSLLQSQFWAQLRNIVFRGTACLLAAAALCLSCSDDSINPPGNRAPDAPALVEPADGALAAPTTVDLVWNGTDPDGDALTYDVYFGTDNPPTTVVANSITATQHTVSGLNQSGTYYWRVISRDPGDRTSISSEVWRFTVGTFSLGWIVKAPMLTSRLWPASAVANGKFYVMGGLSYHGNLDVNEVYDPSANEWTEIAPMPSHRAYGEAVENQGQIYVLGGSSSGIAMATLEKYDPTADSWSQLEPMPTARSRFSATQMNGKIYVFGGMENETAVLAYDIAGNEWNQVGTLPKPLFAASATAYNGMIYLVGGSDPDEFWKNDVTVFNPANGSFTPRAEMPTRRHSHRASLVNGKIYVTGGLNAEITHIFFASVEVYDIATNSWLTRSQMNVRRHDHAAGVINGRIYVAGGLTDLIEPDIINHVEEYDPSNDQ